MSEDSKRQWTHNTNRTLQRNLGLFPLFLSPIFGLTSSKWDNIGLTYL